MKTFLRMAFAGMLLAPAALLAAAFEGKVAFQMTSGRDKQSVNQSIKGDKVRMEFPDQKDSGTIIMDTTKKEMMIISDKDKTCMVMALPQAAADAIAKRNDDVKFEKTSETEKILGYTATKYIATSKDGKTDLWLAEGLGTFMGFNSNPMGGKRDAQPKDWERMLAGKELFPMRVVGKDFKMEVTAIDKKPLPDSMFTPPAGYQKFDMGGMMKGALKGMIPGSR